MRPIKFRAWDKEKGVMLTDTGLVNTTFGFGSTVYLAEGNSGFSRSYSYENAVDEPEKWGRPDDLVWMQYTDLKDKNGVEIYEGDVITEEIGEGEYLFAEVIYKDGCFLGKERNFEPEYPISDFVKGEVIGNVYQNPELLEE